MSDPAEGMIAWVRELHRMAATSAIDAGSRLATWLVIGNAGALALAYNGVLQGTACDLRVMSSAVTWFGAGLALAFLGVVAGVVSTLVTIAFLSRSIGSIDTYRLNEHAIEELETEGIEVPDENPLKAGQKDAAEGFQRLLAEEARIRWVGPTISIALFAASGAAFIGGVVAPVGKPQVFESCAGRDVGPSKALADGARHR
ncbi:hypothetical protein [Phenylobacterium sp.]|uniref:hypothetical protein n=1 Tax=Phenylobacterium sp. TaxID=1871053 RepID=UPI00301DD873